MRKNGAMFICNRCRKQTFAERFDDGVFDKDALQGWALDHEELLLLQKMQECNFKRGGKEEKSKCAGIGSQKEKAA